jgi:hypothetical protein
MCERCFDGAVSCFERERGTEGVSSCSALKVQTQGRNKHN